MFTRTIIKRFRKKTFLFEIECYNCHKKYHNINCFEKQIVNTIINKIFDLKNKKKFANVSQTKQKKFIKTRDLIVAKNEINISNNN